MNKDDEVGCTGPIFFGIFTFLVTLIKADGGQALVAGVGSAIFTFFLFKIFK
ncbi:hypothetical protein ACJOV8_001410 [Formosa sp. 3Alg 14/1]|uniref:hypothetical protein n=1 Tax=Formosa sp. 3Alg 14/1 TaxID=3382190 RepID=UPI0039BDE372